ncbi:putative general amidase GmdA [Aspergillus ibericus CBS 121593]|uniref:amidase n=1 Tax=Aspergillus ibericus CBS 121593 TaxID=1448316 RepID=A0A395GQC4_9EURO|nr:amidase [Aspergillus ibericus CBS 121593]RAK97695.1 amidase [Aspergillus ibericus CBS 121593]
MTIPAWQQAAEFKRQSTLDAIPEKWRIKGPIPSPTEQRDVTGAYIQQFLTEREIAITETDAVGITERTTTGQWTAVEVTEAFCHRAALAHQLVNCLHEVFFDKALETARVLDAYFAQNGKPLGPLHGLPVSLKDQFHIPGVETTMGYVGWINTFQGISQDSRYLTHESELVKELRAAGAVLYCKTSVPMTLMAGETMNNIINYTQNPKNRFLSSGGSSGGEGALIALRGSPGGFGTDIGGSIRVPAAFNGLYGIRPSVGRMPYEGAANSGDGQNVVLSVIGPLATSARGLTLLFKSVLGQSPWLGDPGVLEIPWREEVEKETRELIQRGPEGLAFGIMYDDGAIQPHPPIKRALKIVEDTVRALGHRLIPWQPPSHHTAMDIADRAYSLDGGADVLQNFALSGEPPHPQIVIDTTGSPQKVAQEIAALNVEKREYQKRYLDYWNSTTQLTGTGRPVDAVIYPCAAHASVIPRKYATVGYTSFINVLDYTSVVVPVTNADKGVDVVTEREYLSELDRKTDGEYDAEAYDGAPAGIQLFGRRLQEEKILVLAEYLGEKIKEAYA